MKLYRIYTENKNLEQIKEIVSKYFAGYTIYRASGFWEKVEEQSIIIEILTNDQSLILAVAKEIKSYNKQQVVLVTSSFVCVDSI